MKLVKRLLGISLISIISVAGCATGSVEKDSWKGKPESEFLKKWGVPDHTGQFRNGEKVHTWIGTEKGEFGTSTCRKSITIDKSGAVIKAVLSGCPTGFGDSL